MVAGVSLQKRVLQLARRKVKPLMRLQYSKILSQIEENNAAPIRVTDAQSASVILLTVLGVAAALHSWVNRYPHLPG